MIKKISKEDYRIINEIKRKNYSYLTDDELSDLSDKIKSKSLNGKPIELVIIEAFALVFELCKRKLGITPFDVQLLGALYLCRGTIIQMQTGEGKTLCAVFSAYVNNLLGKRVHILTFNDYLAKRDADWMKTLYKALGLTVSYIKAEMSTDERKLAYKCDVTYVTAKEAGFDYLRDSIAYDKQDMVHSGFDSVIVDEADSILIDEASIPLVLAGKVEMSENDVTPFSDFVKTLENHNDFDIDDFERNVFFTDEGISKIEAEFNISNLYDSDNLDLLTCLNCALHAEVLFSRDINYIVKDGKVQLIDENTGRIASNRHWPDGLQEAVEAKEGIENGAKGRVLGNITILNYISLYEKKSGMTGTAISSQQEFHEMYDLDVVEIPQNRKKMRIDFPDQIYINKADKYKAIIKEIKSVHMSERPILIGTCSIEESEYVSQLLKHEGIVCTVLNAKNDAVEAELISKAGIRGAVTVSTNMAGRGVDIKLGGGLITEADEIAQLGGLCIIATSKNESIRIDDQLRGRAGRQGDEGSSKFFMSIEDDLLVRFGLNESLTKTKLKTDPNGKIINKNIDNHILHIQRIIEGQNYEIRLTLNKYAYMLEQQRQIYQKDRQLILSGDEEKYLEKNLSLVKKIEELLGKEKSTNLLKQILLYKLDSFWVDYLEFVSYVREGIHLISLSKENPLYHYHLQIIKAFDEMMLNFDESIYSELNVLIKLGGKYVPQRVADVSIPTATWTYIVSDNEFINRIRKSKRKDDKGYFVSMKGVIFWPKYLFDYLVNRYKKIG